MLGRQSWVGSLRKLTRDYMVEALKQYAPEISYEDLSDPQNPFSEPFFEALGFDRIDSIDNSTFENATIIADLGQSWGDDMSSRFDYIYDGGTLEHVFELPTALRNIDKALKPGGYFQAHHPTNNFANHGFFQISPEMVFGFWHLSLGYEILSVNMVPLRPVFIGKEIAMTNPIVTKKRPRFATPLPTNSPIILDYVVRKPLTPAEPKLPVYQSDYAFRWLENRSNRMQNHAKLETKE